MNRSSTSISSIPDIVGEGPLGTLFAFITEDDPHSPIMNPRYEEFCEQLHGPNLFFIEEERRVG